MTFEELRYEELIQYCKDNDLDYLTKTKKPKAHATLLKELSKLSITDKTVKTDKTDIQTNNLELIIKQCHNYLYKSAGIVGSKAQNDIMRILIIRIFNILLSNKNEYIEKLLGDYKETNSILKDFKNTYNEDINNITNEEEKEIIQKHLNYIVYLYDINKILEYKGNAIEDEWKEFIIYCVSDILKNIYSKDDYRFNTPNSYDINELIKIISKISINDDFISNFAEHNGDIHEYFLKYQGNTNSKELGQFFTPRIIIEKTLNECGLKDIILNLDNSKLDICDPCMGTGGLLCYTYKYCKDKILPSNIYGCDIEKDTIKFGVASLMLTTNEYNENIIRCNSLIENPYLFENKKFDIVFTNPPFGTKNNYKDLKNNFESYKKLNYKDSSLKFENIYPINTNKGTNLFIQLVVYLLKENGICAIVLPDGELITSNNNNNIEIRKFILNKCKILKIINVEGGTFTNTGIKTKVLIFQKGNFDNYNQEVEFVEINSNGINSLGLEKLNSTFQFNISKKEEIINYNKDIEIKTLGEICDIDYGTRIVKNNNIEGEFPVYGSGRATFTTNTYNREGYNILIGRFALSEECVRFINNKIFLNDSGLSVKPKTDIILHKYIGYYLFHNQSIIYNYARGSAQKNLDIDEFKKLKIPIPSLEQQKEIVEYLDIINKNTKSSNDKIEEIKKLNEKYLKLNLIYNKNIENKTLEEVCEVNQGNSLTKTDMINGIYDVIGGGKIIGKHNQKNRDGGEFTLTRVGDININYIDKPYYLTDNGFSLKSIKEDIMTKYIYYILSHNKDYLTNLYQGTAQKVISKTNLKSIKIPISSLEKQKEIVEYLDFNNNLINNFNKEIENNKKQGESFFNMFLSD
jgi:type I restriction enzyme S subunit